MSPERDGLWRGLRDFFATSVELHERLLLLNQPWREEFLHWSIDGQLHGWRPPPLGRHNFSTTSTGWCPGHGRGRSHR